MDSVLNKVSIYLSINLLEIKLQPITDLAVSLWTKKPTPCSCLSIISTTVEQLMTIVAIDFTKCLPSDFTEADDIPLVML